MRVTLWGTRGSIASAGPETVRYGGNTACVEVRGRDGSLLVLDAGTGIRRLGATIGPEHRRIDVLLTHLHMDHIQGLGFFQPLFRPQAEVHIWGPPSTTLDLQRRLTRYLSPPLFPVRLRDLPSRVTLHDAPFDPFEIGEFRVTARSVIHPGPTLGYRIEGGPGLLAYLPDHEPALGAARFPDGREWTSGIALADGVDVLLHDAQYTPDEYEERVGWGHSTVQHAAALASQAGARMLVTFHHDPAHHDVFLDALVEEASRASDGLPVIGGREGATFDVSA